MDVVTTDDTINSISAVTIHQKNILDYIEKSLHQEVCQYFFESHQQAAELTTERLKEVLKFLFISSCYEKRFNSQFFPLTKEADDIWHYLIIQTREYQRLCDDLPGKGFIHHKSMTFERYGSSFGLSRSTVIRDLLDWIPLYCKHFNCFTLKTSKYWRIVSFLLEKKELSLELVNKL